MKKKLRTLQLPEGFLPAVTSFRLTVDEWAAIEIAAGAEGQSWSNWARALIQANPTCMNATAMLRDAALRYLLSKHTMPIQVVRVEDVVEMLRKELA